MTNNTNTQIIAHAETLALVQEADQLVAGYLERSGVQASSAGILLSCLAIAADNVDGFDTVRFTIDYRGYAIEFDGDQLTAFDVLADLRQAMGIIEETMAEED